MAIDFKQATLDNGLTVVAEVDDNAHTAACGFFVRTGARDESTDVMGVSHFLEHMMFKGTKRRTAADVNREFDEIGARYNAYTTAEMTTFYASILPERLDQAVDLLGDMLRPALREEDFATEKNVILEEIAMYMDQPFWVLYERVTEERFGKHPLGHRILGTTDTIEALTAAQMREYFTARYSADNTTVALAGKLDFDQVMDQLQSLCGSWNTASPTRDTSAAPAHASSFTTEDERVHRCYQLMLAPGPGAQDERRYAASMLAMAMGDSDNSRLYWALVDPGLADEASMSFDPHDHEGNFLVYASCDPERADEVWSLIELELSSIRTSVTDADLERIRNKAATAATVAGERPGGRMQRLGRLWTYLGEYKSLEDELEAINGVTLDDIHAVYDAFPLKPRAYGRMMPASA